MVAASKHNHINRAWELPELPEVETVCRGLAPAMVGATFRRVECRRADLRFPFPDHFVDRLQGVGLVRLGRRAKYLCGHLSSGDVLIMHLGMSGRFAVEHQSRNRSKIGEYVQETGGDPAHDHVVFHMSNGATVTYNDTRRFGLMDLVAEDDLEVCRHFAGMGVEPLGNALNADYLAARASGRTTDMKAFLLDQRNIAGLGNIYVCEALWRSGISPRRLAGTVPGKRATRLVPAIRGVLIDAIAAGGSSLRDYAHTDGSLGYFQHAFAVYDQENKPCQKPNCPGTIRRIVQSGRSTFYCGKCQR